MKYAIPEKNFEKLLTKMNNIRKKIQKYGGEFTFEILGDHFEEIMINDIEMTVKFIDVEVDGKLEFKGWKYCASVENTEKGNVIITRGGEEIPEKYYHSAPVCDHCHSNRYRRYTYIIRNVNTNEYKQVGKSCLEEYTCGLNAEAVAAYLQMFEEIQHGTIDRSNDIYYVNRDNVLLGLIAYLNKWHIAYKRSIVSRGRVVTPETYNPAYSYKVADAVNKYIPCKSSWRPGLSNSGKTPKAFYESYKSANVTDTDKDLIEQCKAWYNEQADDRGVDFHNYKTLMTLEQVPIEDFGILCNGFVEWSWNELHREAEEKIKELREQYLQKCEAEEQARKEERNKQADIKFMELLEFVGKNPVEAPDVKYVSISVTPVFSSCDGDLVKDEDGIIYNVDGLYRNYVKTDKPSVIQNAKVIGKTRKVSKRPYDITSEQIELPIVTLSWKFNDAEGPGTRWTNNELHVNQKGNTIADVTVVTKNSTGFAGNVDDSITVVVNGFKKITESNYGTTLYEATDKDGKIYGVWSKTALTTQPCVIEGKITKLNEYRGRRSTIIKPTKVSELDA